MKLTKVLWSPGYSKYKNRLRVDYHWKRQTDNFQPVKVRPLDPKLLDIVENRDAPLVDAAEWMNRKEKVTASEEDQETIDFYNRPMKSTTENQHAHIDELFNNEEHEKSAFVYEYPGFLRQSLPQAQVLTNTVLRKKLPSSYYENIAALSGNLSDETVRALKWKTAMAHVWYPRDVKLPRRFNPKAERYNHSREYGVDWATALRTCLRSYLSVAATYQTERPNFLKEMTLVPDQLVNYAYRYPRGDGSGGDDLVVIRGIHPFLQVSFRDIISPGVPSSVEATLEEELPKIFPIDPLVELNQTRTYCPDSHLNWRGDQPPFPAPHCHTLFLLNTEQRITMRDHELPVFGKLQRYARMLLHSHATASVFAQRLDIASDTVLKTPITLQCVAFDGMSFDFLLYKLNTTAKTPRGSNGIKNEAYFDVDNKLCTVKRDYLKEPVLSDFDVSAAEKFIFFALNGSLRVT